MFVWYGDGEPVGEPDYFDIITDPGFSYDQTIIEYRSRREKLKG